MKQEPRWLDRAALLILHEESLAHFGGARGIRDLGPFESALDRARNQFQYDPDADLAALAAAYGFGLAKNHPFVDGNKRAAFLGIGLFLALNGKRLRADPVDAIHVVQSLAAGELTEQELAGWIRANIGRR